jgi:hypothetical protein
MLGAIEMPKMVMLEMEILQVQGTCQHLDPDHLPIVRIGILILVDDNGEFR